MAVTRYRREITTGRKRPNDTDSMTSDNALQNVLLTLTTDKQLIHNTAHNRSVVILFGQTVAGGIKLQYMFVKLLLTNFSELGGTL